MSDSRTVHLAGPDVRTDTRLRQLCAWCGTVLIDAPLPPPVEPTWEAIRVGDRVPPGAVLLTVECAEPGHEQITVQIPAPPRDAGIVTWEPFALVAVELGVSPYALERDGTMPPDACMVLP